MPDQAEAAQGKREQTKQRNREAILQAAAEAFLAMGYEACSVRDIVRRTELATGTFYNYFPDKESVFRALIDEHAGRIAGVVREYRRRAEDGESFIRLGFSAYFGELARHPVSFELARRNETVIGHLYDVPMVELAMGQLLADTRAAMERGWLPAVDAEYLAGSFMGVAHEVGRVMTGRRPMDPEGAAAFATGLFLGGLAHQELNAGGEKR
jgi:AcrR family transcriptional regulator